jgi:hypothetical protein
MGGVQFDGFFIGLSTRYPSGRKKTMEARQSTNKNGNRPGRLLPQDTSEKSPE